MAVAIMMGSSLAYGSPACMTQSEARAKFPKAHLYWHASEHCWNDSAAYGFRTLAAAECSHSTWVVRIWSLFARLHNSEGT
jgi:hypothetical protein